MSISYIKIFNQVVDEFFNELIDIFPEEKSINVRYMLFQTLIKADSKKPAMDFMLNSIPYLENIAMRDENFFIGNNTLPFLQALNIKKLWTPELSQVTKDSIWRYIQTFFNIGFRLIEMPPETHNIINYIINFK